MTNYIHIYILPLFGKIMRKAMGDRLRAHMEKIAILYPRQFGFRPGHSVDFALVSIQELITKTIDANFLSVSSAPGQGI